MKLAINGGTPVRTELLPSQNTITHLEKAAVQRVMNSGDLTGYKASWGRDFKGGREVKALEEEWAAKFHAKHAIAVNSATSGLFVGYAALHRKKSLSRAGVTPFSMTCSATIPMHFEDHVMFGDIEEDYYCIDPNVDFHPSILPHVIIAVDLFGQPFDAEGMKIKYPNALILEDAAQALGSQYKDGSYAGTLGHIGVFSLNLGKHLTCGEGGIILTNDDDLAMACRLLMNHGEAVNSSMRDQNVELQFPYLVGLNLRMTEMQAAIARVQLSRMHWLLARRTENVEYLIQELADLPVLIPPKVREGCTHTYYVLPFEYNEQEAEGLHRNEFIRAVCAELAPVAGREYEGVPIGNGYIRPIQSMPAFGMGLGNTPVCTRKWISELIVMHRFFGPMATKESLDDVVKAFYKVWTYREELK